MDPTLYLFIKYLHVLLFVYWLGGDLGVWMTGKQLIRDDLTLDERMRTRQIGVIIDMAPRTCLVLMVPVGFTLASNWGAPLQGPTLIALWVFGLAWLWLVWQVHWKKSEPIGQTLQNVDLGLRYVLGTIILAFGGYCLMTGGPVADKWLATKITLYGLIIFNGIVLRVMAAKWGAAFAMVRAGGDQKAEGEALLKSNRRKIEPAVLSIWALVAIMGFLGVVKPY